MMLMIDRLGIFIAAFFTLSGLSFLWKDNAVYRFGTQTVIGVVVAHTILTAMSSLQSNAIQPILNTGQIILVVPILIGLMTYFRLKSGMTYLSKYPISFLIGVGTGTMIVGLLRGQIINQVKLTITDVFRSSAPMDMFNGILIFVGVLTSLSFFIFTREHKGTLGASAKIGRIFLMISLGVNWAAETVYYLAQFTGRMLFLWNEFILKAILGG